MWKQEKILLQYGSPHHTPYIAGLARIVRDVGVAEDLAQDALVAALEQWPDSAPAKITA